MPKFSLIVFLSFEDKWLQTPLDIVLFPTQRMIILTVLWTSSYGKLFCFEIDTLTVVLQYGVGEILKDLTASCFLNFHRDTRRCWIDFPSNARKLLTSRKLSRALMWIKITSLTLRNGEPIWNRMFYKPLSEKTEYIGISFVIGLDLFWRPAGALLEKWRRATWSLWSVGYNMAARLYFVKIPSLQAIQGRPKFLSENIFLSARHSGYLLFISKLMYSRCRI